MPTKFLKFSPTFTINHQLVGKTEKAKNLKKVQPPHPNKKNPISTKNMKKNNKIKEKKELLKFWENNFMNMRTFKIYKTFVICCLHLMNLNFMLKQEKV